MVTFEEAADMLDEIAEGLPQEFFGELTGGVYLLPDMIKHPESLPGRPLFTLGEYIRHYGGRYINLYYGSFRRVYGHYNAKQMRGALRRVLLHEFTHHLEFLAGERGLEVKDEIEMERYLRMENT